MTTALIIGGVIGLPFIVLWIGHLAYRRAIEVFGQIAAR